VEREGEKAKRERHRAKRSHGALQTTSIRSGSASLLLIVRMKRCPPVHNNMTHVTRNGCGDTERPMIACFTHDPLVSGGTDALTKSLSSPKRKSPPRFEQHMSSLKKKRKRKNNKKESMHDFDREADTKSFHRPEWDNENGGRVCGSAFSPKAGSDHPSQRKPMKSVTAGNAREKDGDDGVWRACGGDTDNFFKTTCARISPEKDDAFEKAGLVCRNDDATRAQSHRVAFEHDRRLVAFDARLDIIRNNADNATDRGDVEQGRCRSHADVLHQDVRLEPLERPQFATTEQQESPTERETPSLGQLATDILAEVMCYCSASCIGRLGITCSSMANLVQDEQTMTYVYNRRVGPLCDHDRAKRRPQDQRQKSPGDVRAGKTTDQGCPPDLQASAEALPRAASKKHRSIMPCLGTWGDVVDRDYFRANEPAPLHAIRNQHSKQPPLPYSRRSSPRGSSSPSGGANLPKAETADRSTFEPQQQPGQQQQQSPDGVWQQWTAGGDRQDRKWATWFTLSHTLAEDVPGMALDHDERRLRKCSASTARAPNDSGVAQCLPRCGHLPPSFVDAIGVLCALAMDDARRNPEAAVFHTRGHPAASVANPGMKMDWCGSDEKKKKKKKGSHPAAARWRMCVEEHADPHKRVRSLTSQDVPTVIWGLVRCDGSMAGPAVVIKSSFAVVWSQDAEDLTRERYVSSPPLPNDMRWNAPRPPSTVHEEASSSSASLRFSSSSDHHTPQRDAGTPLTTEAFMAHAAARLDPPPPLHTAMPNPHPPEPSHSTASDTPANRGTEQNPGGGVLDCCWSVHWTSRSDKGKAHTSAQPKHASVRRVLAWQSKSVADIVVCSDQDDGHTMLVSAQHGSKASERYFLSICCCCAKRPVADSWYKATGAGQLRVVDVATGIERLCVAAASLTFGGIQGFMDSPISYIGISFHRGGGDYSRSDSQHMARINPAAETIRRWAMRQRAGLASSCDDMQRQGTPGSGEPVAEIHTATAMAASSGALSNDEQADMVSGFWMPHNGRHGQSKWPFMSDIHRQNLASGRGTYYGCITKTIVPRWGPPQFDGAARSVRYIGPFSYDLRPYLDGVIISRRERGEDASLGSTRPQHNDDNDDDDAQRLIYKGCLTYGVPWGEGTLYNTLDMGDAGQPSPSRSSSFSCRHGEEPLVVGHFGSGLPTSRFILCPAPGWTIECDRWLICDSPYGVGTVLSAPCGHGLIRSPCGVVLHCLWKGGAYTRPLVRVIDHPSEASAITLPENNGTLDRRRFCARLLQSGRPARHLLRLDIRTLSRAVRTLRAHSRIDDAHGMCSFESDHTYSVPSSPVQSLSLWLVHTLASPALRFTVDMHRSCPSFHTPCLHPHLPTPSSWQRCHHLTTLPHAPTSQVLSKSLPLGIRSAVFVWSDRQSQ